MIKKCSLLVKKEDKYLTEMRNNYIWTQYFPVRGNKSIT